MIHSKTTLLSTLILSATIFLSATVFLTAAESLRGTSIVDAERRNLRYDDGNEYEVTSSGLKHVSYGSSGSYTRIKFPKTETDEFVHGFCVKGSGKKSKSSLNFSTSTNDKRLDYRFISSFRSGTKLWADRNYYVQSGTSST